MMTMPNELDNLETQILAWLDGQLDQRAAQALQQKMAQMPGYQSLLTDLQQQRDALQRQPRQAVPPELSRRLEQLVETAPPTSSRFGRRYRLAASVLLMLGVGVVAYQMLPQPAATAPRAENQLAGRQPSYIAYDEKQLADRSAAAQASSGGLPLRLDARAQNTQTVIYLSASDASAAQQQVASVLRSNNIVFYQAPQELAAQLVSDAPAPAGALDSAGSRANAVHAMGETVAMAEPEPQVGASARSRAMEPEQDGRNSPHRQKAMKPLAGGGARSAPAAPVTVVPSSPAPSASAALSPAKAPSAPAPTAAAKADQAYSSQVPDAVAGIRRDLAPLSSRLPQSQVYVAHNLRADEVAQVEMDLQRPAPQPAQQAQAARVRSTLNSQLAAPQTAPLSFHGYAAVKSSAREASAEKKDLSSTQPTSAAGAVMDLLIVVEGSEPPAPTIPAPAATVPAPR